MYLKIMVRFLILVMVWSMCSLQPLTAQAATQPKNIYDAELLPGGDVAVLYLSGSDIYLGIWSPDSNAWGKTKIAEGKDAALAVDLLGRPHVAYITLDDNLGYVFFDGSAWSAPEIIDSFRYADIDGALSAPDIVLDATGNAHITYMDAEAGDGGYDPYDVADLIYATNASGDFAKTVISYSSGWFWSPDGWRNLVISPPKITMLNSGYCIGAKIYNFNKWMGGQDHSYNYSLFYPGSSQSYYIYAASTNNDLGFRLFDVDSSGTQSYSLFIKSGSLYVAGGTSEIPEATKAFAGSGADLDVSGAGGLFYAGIAADSLLLYQAGTFKEAIALPAAISSSHSRMATVADSDQQYVFYTDTASELWACTVSTTGGVSDLNSFKIPDKLGVNISGIDVADKVYDGSAAAAAGTPTAVVADTGDPAVVSGYTYNWYDVTNSLALTEAPESLGSYKLTVTVAETDSNYTGSLEIPFTISAKTLTITGIIAAERNYDGTNNVAVSGGSLVGVVDGDTVIPSVPVTGTIASASAGSGKSVTLGTVNISGSSSGNYSLTQPAGITVNIDKAPLTVVSATAADKEFDGTAAAQITGVTFSGLQNSESLILDTDYTASGSFASAAIGGGKTVSGTATLAATATAANYVLSNSSFTTTANITAPVVKVIFDDPNLESVVRSALSIPSGDITSTDMATLSSLDASSQKISDLTGLEYASNLATLYLQNNGIADLTPLAGLTQLQTLRIFSNQISDIGPLAGMTALQNLHLGSNSISDIAVLAGLTNLKQLELHGNQISDLSSLTGLSGLQRLSLENNLISDVTDLAGLTNLLYLTLGGNQMTSVAPLDGMTALTELHLQNNQIKNIDILAGIQGLQYLYLNNNLITDISPLNDQLNLIDVDLSNNFLTITGGSDDMEVITRLQGRGANVLYDPQVDTQLVQDFVTRFYQQCLDREPDFAGLDYWVLSLVSNESTGADVATGFVFSNEFVTQNVSDAEYLTVLYRAFFNREADTSGYDYWYNRLQTGTGRLTVLAGFVNAPEFGALCEAYGITQGSIESEENGVGAFVTRFYEECLGRTPDATGLAYWVDRLTSGASTGADVAYGFVYSNEFQAQGLNDQQYLGVLYTAFFNRDPDAGGLAHWLNQLGNGTSRLQVLAGFVNSGEFAALCDEYGIQAGQIKV